MTVSRGVKVLAALRPAAAKVSRLVIEDVRQPLVSSTLPLERSMRTGAVSEALPK